MKTTSEFEEGYARLNTEQKKAVDSIDGPVFVIAGPGTGKTQVLTLRIANILRTTDTPADAILALTFTEAAASEMRQRLSRILGSRASRVRIHTFHGFAESIISRFPDQFPRIIGAHIATDVERAELLDQVLLSTPVQHLRPFGDPLYYHPHVARAISTMKRENVTPDALEIRIQDAQQEFENIEGKVHEKGKYAGKMKGEFLTLKKRIEKTVDLLQVYRAYEESLTIARRYDFEDLILEVVHALEVDEDFRLQVQESLLYVLADEHQDANRAQNALLEQIPGFHERPNLFIVGDEKQAIYRFQGADLDNVHYFRSRFPDTVIVALVENYRSTQPILDSALSLIDASPDERLSRVPLIANSKAKARSITLTPCETPEIEMAQLAENIRNTLADGASPSDIAVLVRRNRDVEYVAQALTNEGISVTGAGENNAMHNRFVLALIRLLTAIQTASDENMAGIFTLPGFPLSSADIWRVTHTARKSRMPILSVLASNEQLTLAGVTTIDAARALGASLEGLSRLASIERPAIVAEEALRVSGLLPVLLSSRDRAESLAAVRALLHSFEDLSRREHGALLPRALELLTLMETRGITLSGNVGEDLNRVKVMTVHKSKGREFAYVFIPKLTESAWSTRSRPEHFHLPDVLSGSIELEDERRLLYVGITRAKEHATLSYAMATSDGRADAPSELVEDLDSEKIEVRPATVVPLDVLTKERVLRSQNDGPSEDDLQTLRTAFLAQGISPTALNNFLECSWKYFYVNLLRIPEAENKFMLYGTAIHAALKRYADGRAQNTDIGVDGLMAAFERRIERAPLTESDIAELQAKGERALRHWWNEHHDSWPSETRAEQSVEAHLELPTGESLLIRGALDRVDETRNGISVVDYKTGKPKSRNELMGETKNSDGNYYRQLTFYKLLLAKGEEHADMREGVIEFVEPDDNGSARTESFEIPQEHVDELETLIQKTAHSILTLSFWNEPCDEKDCPWCRLRFGLSA